MIQRSKCAINHSLFQWMNSSSSLLRVNKQFYAKRPASATSSSSSKNVASSSSKHRGSPTNITTTTTTNTTMKHIPLERASFKPKTKKVLARHRDMFVNHILPNFIKKHCPPMITKNQLPEGFKQGFLYKGEKAYYGSRWLYKVNVVGHNGTVRQVYLFEPLKFQFEDFEHPLSEIEIPAGMKINDHPAIKAFKAQQVLLWRNFFDKQSTDRKLESMGLEKIRCPWNK